LLDKNPICTQVLTVSADNPLGKLSRRNLPGKPGERIYPCLPILETLLHTTLKKLPGIMRWLRLRATGDASLMLTFKPAWLRDGRRSPGSK